MDERAWEPPPLLLCGGMGVRPHACRDGGRCRHLDSPLRHRAREQATVLPMLCACQPCVSPCWSPSQALQTGWHRSCSATAHKKQPLRTTRRKAAAEGLIAREALPPQTLPVLYTFRRRRVMTAFPIRFATLEKLGAERCEIERPDLSKQIRDAKKIDAVLDLVGNSVMLDSLAMLRCGGRSCLGGRLCGRAP